MPIRTQITATSGVYFITFTCYNWLPLIKITNAYDAVYRQFDFLKTAGHHVLGYVIMPNHIHVVIAFSNTGKSINNTISTIKRFLAYELVRRLKQQQETNLLIILEDGVQPTDEKKGKLHEIWEPSFDAKPLYTDEYIVQKLDYMHNNPCSGKWQLADTAGLYPHSSASFYFTGQQGVYEVMNYRQLADMNLDKTGRPGWSPQGQKTEDPAGIVRIIGAEPQGQKAGDPAGNTKIVLYKPLKGMENLSKATL